MSSAGQLDGRGAESGGPRIGAEAVGVGDQVVDVVGEELVERAGAQVAGGAADDVDRQTELRERDLDAAGGAVAGPGELIRSRQVHRHQLAGYDHLPVAFGHDGSFEPWIRQPRTAGSLTVAKIQGLITESPSIHSFEWAGCARWLQMENVMTLRRLAEVRQIPASTFGPESREGVATGHIGQKPWCGLPKPPKIAARRPRPTHWWLEWVSVVRAVRAAEKPVSPSCSRRRNACSPAYVAAPATATEPQNLFLQAADRLALDGRDPRHLLLHASLLCSGSYSAARALASVRARDLLADAAATTAKLVGVDATRAGANLLNHRLSVEQLLGDPGAALQHARAARAVTFQHIAGRRTPCATGLGGGARRMEAVRDVCEQLMHASLLCC
ncbi:hypothetical protein ACWED2_09345 [Amycolatopsis sp. NPDC005003]